MQAVYCFEDIQVIMLPRDVWQYIFRLAVEPDPQCPRTRLEILESITHSCGDWRRMAMDMPDLWQTIEVEVNPPSWEMRFSFFPRTELIESWLMRSGDVPLDIQVRGRGSVEEHRLLPVPHLLNHHDLMSLLSVLFNHLRRWRRVEISGIPNFDSLSLSLFHATEDGAPMLERLWVDTWLRSTEVHETRIPFRLWNQSPLLRELSFNWGNLDSHRRPMMDWAIRADIPFAQLTRLELNTCEWATISVYETIYILEQCQSLITFSVVQIQKSNSRVIPDIEEPILLPKLEELSLSVADGEMRSYRGYPLTSILVRYDMPALKSLTIGSDHNWGQQDFTSFVKRSKCHLKALLFNETRLMPQQFKKCLHLCPGLKTIHLSTWCDPWLLSKSMIELLSAWDVKKTQFNVCPDLEAISFDMMLLEPDNSNLFTGMIEKRRRPPSGEGHLKSLRLLGKEMILQ